MAIAQMLLLVSCGAHPPRTQASFTRRGALVGLAAVGASPARLARAQAASGQSAGEKPSCETLGLECTSSGDVNWAKYLSTTAPATLSASPPGGVKAAGPAPAKSAVDSEAAALKEVLQNTRPRPFRYSGDI